MTANRPFAAVALESLMSSGKALIIDDFHFVSRALQRQVVRSLKHPVFKGLTVVVISTSHRLLDVILAEPNMDGRAAGLKVAMWSDEELAFIADEGFKALNLTDPDGSITQMLIKNSFGSPHLMQKFCKAICRLNGIRYRAEPIVALEGPEDWDKFFRDQVEGIAERWFDRLLRGPQERGNSRTKWARRKGGEADNYVLVMEAVALADDGFVISKDRIKMLVDSIATGDSPPADKTTRVLQRISKIASRPLEDEAPSEDELDDSAQGESNFVLEFVDEGPNSKLHITDPFFAYYLRWGAAAHLEKRIHDMS